MSKMGNRRVGLQETGSYMFGWKSAERGEPRPEVEPGVHREWDEVEGERMGWDDYHAQDRTL